MTNQIALNKKNRICFSIFPYLCLAAISVLLLNNLFYGYGWTDESLYLADTHRLFNGEKLFLDNWNPTQTYVPLLLPLYAAFIKFTGGTDGVYLFFRIATLLFQMFVSFAVYAVMSKKNSRAISFCAAAVLLAFARAGIPGPSYYTLGLMNFALGFLCIYAVFENNMNSLIMIPAGIFLAFAVLCNPYLAIPYIAASALLLAIPSARKHWKLYAFSWGGTVFCAAVYAVLFIPFGSIIDEFWVSLRYIFNDPEYSRKPIYIIKSIIKCPRLLLFPYIITYFPAILTLIIAWAKKIKSSERLQRLFFALNTFLLIANFFIVENEIASPVIALFFYTLLIIISRNGLNPKNWYYAYKTEIIFSIIPGIALSYFFCLASNTGFGVCGIGMAFAAFGFFSIIKKCQGRFFLVPLVAVCTCTLLFRISTFYRDVPLKPHLLFIPSLSENCVKITEGSAKGLYTTEDNKRQYNLVMDTMRSINCTDGDGLLISQLIPWAYLERKELRCASPHAWRLFIDDYRIEPYFTDFPRHRFPQFVLIVDKNIRDNNRKRDVEEQEHPWLLEQLSERKYTEQSVPCGVLYIQSTPES